MALQNKYTLRRTGDGPATKPWKAVIETAFGMPVRVRYFTTFERAIAWFEYHRNRAEKK